jgi:hypothetical protein
VVVFTDDSAESVGLVLRNASVIEYKEGELTPFCKLTPHNAMRLAAALARHAKEIQA